MEWYLKVLRQYAEFNGRARRMEYWMFSLVNFLIAIVLQFVAFKLGLPVLSSVYSLALFIPSLAVTVRRLHDLDKSGFWILIGLIPVVGWIWILVLLVSRGTAGENNFGADPLAGGRA